MGFQFDSISKGLNSIIVAPDLTSADGAAQGEVVTKKTLPNLAKAKGFLGDFLRSREQNIRKSSKVNANAKDKIEH